MSDAGSESGAVLSHARVSCGCELARDERDSSAADEAEVRDGVRSQRDAQETWTRARSRPVVSTATGSRRSSTLVSLSSCELRTFSIELAPSAVSGNDTLWMCPARKGGAHQLRGAASLSCKFVLVRASEHMCRKPEPEVTTCHPTAKPLRSVRECTVR